MVISRVEDSLDMPLSGPERVELKVWADVQCVEALL